MTLNELIKAASDAVSAGGEAGQSAGDLEVINAQGEPIESVSCVDDQLILSTDK